MKSNNVGWGIRRMRVMGIMRTAREGDDEENASHEDSEGMRRRIQERTRALKEDMRGS